MAARGKTGTDTLGRSFPADFETVGRLLETVREAGERIPADMLLPAPGAPDSAFLEVRQRRTRLAHEIQRAVRLWQTSAFHEDARRQRSRSAKAETIRKAAERLARLIADDGEALADPVLLHELDAKGTDAEPLLEPMRAMLDTLERRAAKAKAIADDIAKGPPVLNGGLSATPAFHKRLVRIYEATFGGWVVMPIDTTGEPFGPFVAFVQAIRREVGADAEPQSVLQALDRAGWAPKQRDANGQSVFVTRAAASRNVPVRGQERPSRATGRDASGKPGGDKDCRDDRRGDGAFGA